MVTVVPRASVAAIITLAVPGLGATSSTKKTFATCQLLCLGVNVPCLHTNFRPEVSHALQVKVDRASPMTHPPGMETFASLRRPISGPRIQMETAHLSDEVVVAESLYLLARTRAVPRPTVTSAPSDSNIRHMNRTSLRFGRLRITTPDPSAAWRDEGSAAFFAPLILTSPFSRCLL